jgi:lipoate-protein ligase A
MEIKWKWNNTDGIFLDGNPLESPPVEIIKKGIESVRQYFKSLEDHSRKLWKKILKIAGFIAAIIAFVAALFTILESEFFQKILDKFTG